MSEPVRYRVFIADILSDNDDDTLTRARRIAYRLRTSDWVQSLPEHELVHSYIGVLESDKDPGAVVMAMQSIFDEAAYHRVHIESVFLVPNPEEV